MTSPADRLRPFAAPGLLASPEAEIADFTGIAAERDPDVILRRATRVAQLHTGSDGAGGLTVEDGVVTVATGEDPARDATGKPVAELGPLATVLETAHLHRTDDGRGTSILAVPLLSDDGVAGCLFVTRGPGAEPFDARAERVLRAVAAQAALALDNARLIRQLRRHAAIVQLLQDVASSSNEAESIEDAIQDTLDRVCAHMGWPVGHAHLVDEENHDLLVPLRIWSLRDPQRYQTFVDVTERTALRRGVGLCGVVLQTGMPTWIEDAALDPFFVRRDAAIACGIGGGFAFPVLSGKQVLAVLEFFTDRPQRPDQSVLTIMANVGKQLGRVVERTRIAAELQRLDVIKSEFIANAAHELRTPLTTITGFTDILSVREDQLTEETRREILDGLARQADRVRVLIDNLLDLSMIDRGALRVQMRPVALAAAARRALDAAPAPVGITVVIDVAEELSVMADLPRLDQILINLLTNAYRYGGPNITITGNRSADGHIALSVADDGDGVPEALVEHLFDPFTRAANASRVSGSGLGLTISRRLARAFGGDLTYATKGGACFTLLLAGEA